MTNRISPASCHRPALRALLCVAITSLALVALAPATAVAWTPLDRCAPTWDSVPSGYHVNQVGYSRIDLPTVRRIFADSMDEWARPCCSDWSATDLGLTTGVGEDGGNPQYIFSFRTGAWPRELGDATSTLGITLTRWSTRGGDCFGLTADMVFNAATHTFGTSETVSTVDLQAVATHESGHWLGLGHSSVSGSTMWPVHTGEGDRSLHADDETGVCTLYPGDCGCTTARDCDPDEVCEAGRCEPAPCTSDLDCATGLECDRGTGDCIVPPCRGDDDCLGAQICVDGECIIDADCPTCLPCVTLDDCGGGVWQCASDGANGFCTRNCETPDDCPGNSECFGISGQPFSICLNDDADSVGACPNTYVCTETPSLCEGVGCAAGEVCNPDTGACERVGGADGCIVCDPCDVPDDCPGGDCWSFTGADSVCAVACGTGGDCPPGTDCFDFSISGGGDVSLCLNADLDTVGICPAGFTCADAPEPGPCDGVSCPAGQTCDPATGACVGGGPGPDAGGSDTGAGTDTGTGGSDAGPGGSDAGTGPVASDCIVCNSCDSSTDCPGGACSVVGAAGRVCTIDCAANPAACPGNTQCFDVELDGLLASVCLNIDAGSAGICHDAFRCVESTGGSGGTDAGGGTGGTGGTGAGGTGGDVDAGTDGAAYPGARGSSGWCAIAPHPARGAVSMMLALLGAVVLRRRN